MWFNLKKNTEKCKEFEEDLGKLEFKSYFVKIGNPFFFLHFY